MASDPAKNTLACVVTSPASPLLRAHAAGFRVPQGSGLKVRVGHLVRAAAAARARSRLNAVYGLGCQGLMASDPAKNTLAGVVTSPASPLLRAHAAGFRVCRVKG